MSKKKVLSVVLAASMIASVAVTSAVTSYADDNVRGTLYFDSTGPLEGADRDTYYCYAWGSDGSGEIAAFNTAPLKMKKVDGQDNLYSYDMPKTNKAGDVINADLIIFSTVNDGQTYDTTFSDYCFGDTAYVTENLLENPVDSAKTAYECLWKNNPQEGAHIAITSTGKVQGVGILSTETPESITDAFIANYKAGMDAGKTGYDNPDLITDTARQGYIDQINAIIASQPTRPTQDPNATEPTKATEATEATEATTPEQPTVPVAEVPTEDQYGRIAGLPLPADMNVPAQDPNPDATFAGWNGYYNVYYFEAPQEWIDEHKDAKEKDENGEPWDIGFYWYTGSVNNGEWPGVKAQKLSVLDENGNDIYADSNIYYAFAPTYANSIIWNNGISDAVAENKKYKLQTKDINVDDPGLSSIGLELYDNTNGEIEGAFIAGCLSYVSSTEETVNGLTGDVMTVYNCEWKYFNPRTGETTVEPLKDADGNFVTLPDDVNGYSKVAVNPYFDMNYAHINTGAEQPTGAPASTLPPASTDPKQTVTTPSTTNNNNNNNSGKGTVDTSESTAVAVLGTVLLAAMGVVFVSRKRKTSEEV